MADKGNLRVCLKGHRFFKTSSCPVCPVCEITNAPSSGFLSKIGAPARRALIESGITTLHQLSIMSETEILKLHGMGPSTIPKLHKLLKEEGLSFRSD